jgi:hypothetical protein
MMLEVMPGAITASVPLIFLLRISEN